MSKILKFDNKIVHKLNNTYVKKLNGEFVQCGFTGVPGNVVSMDLNGDGFKELYRVINKGMNEHNILCVELMCLYDFNHTQYYNLDEASYTTFNGIEGLQYKGSFVDTYTTSLYNGLKMNAKRCLIAQDKSQSMWQYTYLPITQEEFDNRDHIEGVYYGVLDRNGTPNFYRLNKMEGESSIGERLIYTLSIDDIIRVLGKGGEDDAITYGELFETFWRSDSSDVIDNSVWLSDASFRLNQDTGDNDNKNGVFFINRQYGNLLPYHYMNDFKIRPVFTLDWYKLTEVYNEEYEVIE